MYKLLIKRLFDFTAAGIILLLALPVLAICIILIFVSMGQPILFRQQRPGFNARPFILYKFRTMNNNLHLYNEPLPDAERLTKVGKIIRSLSLDELPQLINVLKGDMSLVGPRPLLMEYLPLYNEEQKRRHDVKPGITGWAQVNGRNAISWEEKFKLDIWYVDNISFMLDMKIIFLTVLKVFKREGISSGTHATMEKFEGSLKK